MAADKKQSRQNFGGELVEEFAAAITNLVTMQTARTLAAQSERDTIRALEDLSAMNGLYVTPEDIPTQDKDQLVRRSLDAHLKKAQSEQISAAAQLQVNSRQANALQRYKGKRLTISSLAGDFQPFEAVWYNRGDGSFRTSPYTAKNIRGIVEDLSLERNLLIIKTTYVARLINPSRPYILVHVINTNTLEPAVTVNA